MQSPMMRKRMTRALSAALALGVTTTIAACNGDQAATTGPVVRQNVAIDQPQLATVLKRTVPLSHDVSASITIKGNRGGELRVPDAGLQVVIPGGALPSSAPVTITVTAVAGDAVAYEFEPHGIVFSVPLSATQDLKRTTWSGHTGKGTLEAAYFASGSDLDVAGGTALISDVFETDVAATGKHLRWGIPHFSGYVIVTGRGRAGAGDGDTQ